MKTTTTLFLYDINYFIQLINNLYINVGFEIFLISGLSCALILFSGKVIKEGLDIACKVTGTVASLIVIKDQIDKARKSGWQCSPLQAQTAALGPNNNNGDKNKKLMKTLKIQIMTNKNNYSFLPFILSQLDISVSSTDSSILQLSYAVCLLSLIALYCLFNIIGYMTAYIIVQNGNYEEKYPRFKKIISYYKKASLVFIIIDVIFCITCLFILFLSSLTFIYLGNN